MNKYDEEDGYCIYSVKKECTYIESITSHKKGFGTRMIRNIIKERLDNNLDGNVKLQACWSSHIFWIYMGMIPMNSDVNYVSSKYGILGREALNHILNPSSSEFPYLSIIKHIINMEYGINIDDINDTIISEKYEDLIKLNNKTSSYIHIDFIPRLLRVLGSKDLNTKYFGSINMSLSDEGLQRWKDCIYNDVDFIPFRDLSHMRQYMDDKQIKILEDIWIQHNIHKNDLN
ncbi:Hypothetical protein ORPV_1046 [Orpheovirus IHUMI-LCC2]|uniref:Uncharacterized protein n=1 Tax=Orpheovirus IHUMI-LCC2 TaxID=2023057 RepID=A0A2I2L626_9VIRU|nr:Hypothetical protein ORPV_1046 [Orpheovirus IHUMI-LCC2]SNW62950.1 Hypothetical protein ORPV_1046 [Orpheovirus IHUMI-LCC2]